MRNNKDFACAVSYTHLDVYKRQKLLMSFMCLFIGLSEVEKQIALVFSYYGYTTVRFNKSFTIVYNRFSRHRSTTATSERRWHMIVFDLLSEKTFSILQQQSSMVRNESWTVKTLPIVTANQMLPLPPPYTRCS